MLREDNSGFVVFPVPSDHFNRSNSGKTFVYLVAFDNQDLSICNPYELSNVHLTMPGTFISDDVNVRPKFKDAKMSIDELLINQIKNDEYDQVYFPKVDEGEKVKSISLTTCICIGWSEFSYELRQSDIGYWHATFRDLTTEGRKLFYSIKKLHNNKEIRILTFNNI